MFFRMPSIFASLTNNILPLSYVLGPSHNKVVVCYVSTWAVYRPDKGSFAIEHIDPNLCTHLVYAFAGLDHVTDAIKSLGNK